MKVMVSEGGASVYSQAKWLSRVPRSRSDCPRAISVARRLQDPRRTGKIDPKSIGVGQYQHDVDQKMLREKLGDTVESCVTTSASI